jgi:hypothetical protein
VVLFCLADLEEVVDLLLLEAEGLEVGGGELGESLLVEGRFEPLECEGAGWVSVVGSESGRRFGFLQLQDVDIGQTQGSSGGVLTLRVLVHLHLSPGQLWSSW